MVANNKGMIFNIERYTIHDGPGIRTTVFLKGCPLRCLWCSNPESHFLEPELAYFPDNCIGCKNCLNKCPEGAISWNQKKGRIKVDFEKCVSCGTCTKYCSSEALVLMGEEMTAEEVIEVVERDIPFYSRSKGGVTLSGGDPLFQPEFSKEILKGCKEKKIHTAIQTCGYVHKEGLDLLLPYLDLIIFDVKHFNSEKHQELTGVRNEVILENLNYLNSVYDNLIIQIPLIPGYNDDEDHLREIFSLAQSLDFVKGISLLAYHRLGVSKYKRLGKDYLLSEVPAPSSDYLKEKKEWAAQFEVPIIDFN